MGGVSKKTFEECQAHIALSLYHLAPDAKFLPELQQDWTFATNSLVQDIHSPKR
jgi:hypothetical protein